jgi:hypothetical protein
MPNEKAITKEEFLAADDLPLEKFDLPAEFFGEDACVYLRMMTARERGDWEKVWMGKDGRDNPGKWRGDLLAQTIVDETGRRLFELADVGDVLGKSAGVIEDIFERACELNGFRETDVEGLEKNSAGGQPGSSSSDSALPELPATLDS